MVDLLPVANNWTRNTALSSVTQLDSSKREKGRRIKETEQVGEHRAVRRADEVLRDSTFNKAKAKYVTVA